MQIARSDKITAWVSYVTKTGVSKTSQHYQTLPRFHYRRNMHKICMPAAADGHDEASQTLTSLISRFLHIHLYC